MSDNVVNYAYLMYISGIENSNKFYEMRQNADRSVDVQYGRIGNKIMRHHYEPWEKDFYTLYREKTAKGYEDYTALHTNGKKEVSCKDKEYEEIKDEDVQKMVDLLINSAREFVKQHYTVSIVDITSKMVAEAEQDLALLKDIARDDGLNTCQLFDFNERLTELFKDIPRKMEKVQYYLASSTADFEKIIQREQDMLDNIKGQLIQAKPQSKKTQSGTVLEAYGLDIRPVTYKEEDEIISHLGRDYNGKPVANRYVKAFAVENNETRTKYEDFKQKHNISPKEVKLFYHGSKVENWWSIMKQGLLLNPNASVTGKMFGNGIYFASDCRKSLNYMDVAGSHWNNGKRSSGYVAIYSVALGKCYKPYSALSNNFNYRNLPTDCLSVYADKKLTGLHNDEYVIYQQEQCTIKYLVEMTQEKVREKTYNLDLKAVRNELSPAFGPLKRCPEGVKTTLYVPALSDIARNEIERCIDSEHDYITFLYNMKSNKIEYSVKDEDGTSKSHYGMNATMDDNDFLCREMKKAFAKSETEWKQVVDTVRDVCKKKGAIEK